MAINASNRNIFLHQLFGSIQLPTATLTKCTIPTCSPSISTTTTLQKTSITTTSYSNFHTKSSSQTIVPHLLSTTTTNLRKPHPTSIAIYPTTTPTTYKSHPISSTIHIPPAKIIHTHLLHLIHTLH